MYLQIVFFSILLTLLTWSCGQETSFVGEVKTPPPEDSAIETYTAGDAEANVIPEPEVEEKPVLPEPPPPPPPPIPVQLTEENIEITTTTSSLATDIYMLVDSSGSMQEENDKVRKNVRSFVEQLTLGNMDLNYRFFLVGDLNGAIIEESDRVKHISQLTVFSRDALTIASGIINGNYKDKGIEKLDPDTKRHHEFIVVTDDNSELSARSFAERLSANGIKSYSVSGIVGLEKGGNKKCFVDNVGSVYLEAAEEAPTPGLILDLCKDDWEEMLMELGEKIKYSIVNTEYVLESFPGEAEILDIIVSDDDHDYVKGEDYEIDYENGKLIVKKPEILEEKEKLKIKYKWKKKIHK